MKKIFFNTLLCAAALMLGISCSKIAETGKIEPQLEDCSVSADVLGADTKVALSGNTPQWQSGDRILVFGTDGKLIGSNGLFTLETGAGSNSGTFKGTKYFGQTPAYAIYPASVYVAATGKFTLPTAQDGTVTTAFKSYAVMMGAIDGSQHIDFKNVCSIVKLNTGDYGRSGGEAAIKSVKLSAATSALTGEFTPNWTGTPSISPADEGTSQEVTVTAAAETGYAQNAEIYIPIIPTDSQTQISLEFTNTDGKVATVSETVTPAANKIKDLGTAGGMEFKTPGPDPEFWVDLGMLSARGYPIYISRRNVASVDPTSRNITFTDEESDLGMSCEDCALDSDTYFYDGLECKVLTSNEAFGLLCSENFTINIPHDYLYRDDPVEKFNVSFTSKINGAVLNLPFEGTNPAYCCGNNPSCYLGYGYNGTNTGVFEVGNDVYMDLSSLYYRMMYEDINKTPVVYSECDFYRIMNYNSTSHINRILDPNFSLQSCDYGSYGEIEGAGKFIFMYSLKESGDNKYTFLSYDISNDFVEIKYSGTDDSGANYPLKYSNVLYDEIFSGTGSDFFHNLTINYKFGNEEKHLEFKFAGVCFVSGTLITLADGSKKPIEEITYNDKLKVWNFDKGCYDSAKIFWLTKAGQKTEHYYKMTFSDGTVLNVLGPQYKSGHKLYNYTDRKFEGVKTLEVGKEVFTENGIVTLVSKEEMNEEVEFYCLMTEDHLNCFADGVLASLRYNNIYPFDENMKFIKDGRKKRPYNEFKEVGISREWYNGLRLGEQTDDLATIQQYVERYDAQTREKPAPSFWQRFRTWWKSIFG